MCMIIAVDNEVEGIWRWAGRFGVARLGGNAVPAATSQARGPGRSRLLLISGSHHFALYPTWGCSGSIVLLLHGSSLRHYGEICHCAHADLGSLIEKYGRRPLFLTTTTIAFSRIAMGLSVSGLMDSF